MTLTHHVPFTIHQIQQGPTWRGRLRWKATTLFIVFLMIGLGGTLSGCRSPSIEKHGPVRSVNPGFYLGLYDVPMGELPAARAAGFELAHLYDSGQSLTNAIRYLTAAQEAGLRVMQNMPSARLHDGDEFWIQWVWTVAGELLSAATVHTHGNPHRRIVCSLPVGPRLW